MKAKVYDISGKESGQIDLPKVFSTKIRNDLIIRAFLSTMSKKRQAHGTAPGAGQRSSAHYHGRRRRERWTMMGREMARMPRLHGKIPGWQMYRARNVPQAVKGRETHPPKVETIWDQKMNNKERQLAIKSCIAATADRDVVLNRGHKVDGLKNVPIVVEDSFESLKKTSEIRKFLTGIGLQDEIERIEKRKAMGKKKASRGRKYKKKVGPIFVVSNDKGISKAVKNMPGVQAEIVGNLSVESLAPGAMAGRLAIFTKGAIEKLK